MVHMAVRKSSRGITKFILEGLNNARQHSKMRACAFCAADTHLDMACLSSCHQKPAIAPEGARVGLVLEAGQRGERVPVARVKDDDARAAGHRIVVGIQRAEVYACDRPNLHNRAGLPS